MNFSIIMPVHNEEKYLRQTLPSHYRLKPTEIIFLLDRCTDTSAEIIQKTALKYKATKTKTFHFEEKDTEGWFMRGAYLRRRGYDYAETPYCLNSSADMILDQSIARHIERLDEYPLISFGFYEYNIPGIVRLIFHAIDGKHYGGLTAFERQLCLSEEDQLTLRRLTKAEDKHLIESVSRKYDTLHIPTLSIHLRPRPHNWGRFIK